MNGLRRPAPYTYNYIGSLELNSPGRQFKLKISETRQSDRSTHDKKRVSFATDCGRPRIIAYHGLQSKLTCMGVYRAQLHSRTAYRAVRICEDCNSMRNFRKLALHHVNYPNMTAGMLYLLVIHLSSQFLLCSTIIHNTTILSIPLASKIDLQIANSLNPRVTSPKNNKKKGIKHS